MSLFFSFINESNDIFKQRELSYHLSSFDIKHRNRNTCGHYGVIPGRYCCSTGEIKPDR